MVTVEVENRSQRAVSCSRIVVRLPVGEGAGDLVPPGKAGDVSVVADAGRDAKWKVERAAGAGCAFVLTAKNDPPVFQEHFTLVIKDVVVNKSAGSAVVVIEETTDTTGSYSFTVEKFSREFMFSNFSPTVPSVARNSRVRLEWEASGAEGFEMFWGQNQRSTPQEPGHGAWENLSTSRPAFISPPLSEATTFLLRATDRAQHDLHHSLATTVQVSEADLTVGNLTVKGNLRTNARTASAAYTLSGGSQPLTLTAEGDGLYCIDARLDFLFFRLPLTPPPEKAPYISVALTHPSHTQPIIFHRCVRTGTFAIPAPAGSTLTLTLNSSPDTLWRTTTAHLDVTWSGPSSPLPPFPRNTPRPLLPMLTFPICVRRPARGRTEKPYIIAAANDGNVYMFGPGVTTERMKLDTSHVTGVTGSDVVGLHCGVHWDKQNNKDVCIALYGSYVSSAERVDRGVFLDFSLQDSRSRTAYTNSGEFYGKRPGVVKAYAIPYFVQDGKVMALKATGGGELVQYADNIFRLDSRGLQGVESIGFCGYRGDHEMAALYGIQGGQWYYLSSSEGFGYGKIPTPGPHRLHSGEVFTFLSNSSGIYTPTMTGLEFLMPSRENMLVSVGGHFADSHDSVGVPDVVVAAEGKLWGPSGVLSLEGEGVPLGFDSGVRLSWDGLTGESIPAEFNAPLRTS
ncbi:hypothetical protein [Streptomyces syringium]|uniref:hypothetical protein n=1 Tax=Streptomyces syringium TaxID=76729 RepID=UPI003454B318